MSFCLCTGGMLKCSFGSAPAPFSALPVPTGPWLSPAPAVMIGGRPALTGDSKLICAWGGQIGVCFAGQAAVQT